LQSKRRRASALFFFNVSWKHLDSFSSCLSSRNILERISISFLVRLFVYHFISVTKKWSLFRRYVKTQFISVIYKQTHWIFSGKNESENFSENLLWFHGTDVDVVQLCKNDGSNKSVLANYYSISNCRDHCSGNSWKVSLSKKKTSWV